MRVTSSEGGSASPRKLGMLATSWPVYPIRRSSTCVEYFKDMHANMQSQANQKAAKTIFTKLTELANRQKHACVW